MDQKRYDIGLKMRKQVLGAEYVDRALQNVDDFNRDFQRLLTEYCWGETWGDDTLKPRERSILNLGMIGALGKMEEFATHVRGALNNGLTPNEIRAALTQSHDLLRRADRRRLLPHRQADHRRVPEEQEVTMLDQPRAATAPKSNRAGRRSTFRSIWRGSKRRVCSVASTGRSTRIPSCIRWCAGSFRAACGRTSGARSCLPT